MAHFEHGSRKPGEKRLAHQKMADIEFNNFWNGGDSADIFVIEPVTSMHFKPQQISLPGCLLQAFEFF